MELRAYGGPLGGQVRSVPPCRDYIHLTASDGGGVVAAGVWRPLFKRWRYEARMACHAGKRAYCLCLHGHEGPEADQVVREAVELAS